LNFDDQVLVIGVSTKLINLFTKNQNLENQSGCTAFTADELSAETIIISLEKCKKIETYLLTENLSSSKLSLFLEFSFRFFSTFK
jgi:hypothetical protein